MGQPICAVSTANGRAAIGIIRGSGDQCLAKLTQIFTPKNKNLDLTKTPRTAIYGNIAWRNEFIDDALCLVFTGGKSYTGEESFELHCHGNPVILNKTLTALFSLGFQPAKPGEFTQRAFLNNKIGFDQANAVQEIIMARNSLELQKANYLKSGILQKKLFQLKSELMNLTADVAAELDFIDQDIVFSGRSEKISQFDDIISKLYDIKKRSDDFDLFRKGIEIAIIGPPNSGKSSLLNFLLGAERAIVSDIAGTTRDFIDGTSILDGIEIRFIDTAGLRQNSLDEIERIGMARSRQKAKGADFIFCMVDACWSEEEILNQWPVTELLQDLRSDAQTGFALEKVIFIFNKIDLAHQNFANRKLRQISTLADFLPLSQAKPSWQNFAATTAIPVSVKHRLNFDLLWANLKTKLPQVNQAADGLLLAAWQKEIISKLIELLEETRDLLISNEMPEILLSNLQTILTYFSELSGEITNEDLLGRIFSRFCIGK